MISVIISFIMVLGWLLHAYGLNGDKYISIDYLLLRVLLIIEIPFTIFLGVQGKTFSSLIGGMLIIIIVVAIIFNRTKENLYVK